MHECEDCGTMIPAGHGVILFDPETQDVLFVHDACATPANPYYYEIPAHYLHANGLEFWVKHMRAKNWWTPSMAEALVEFAAQP